MLSSAAAVTASVVDNALLPRMTSPRLVSSPPIDRLDPPCAAAESRRRLPETSTAPETLLAPASAKATVAESLSEAMLIALVTSGSPSETTTFEVAVGTPALQSAGAFQFALPSLHLSVGIDSSRRVLGRHGKHAQASPYSRMGSRNFRPPLGAAPQMPCL